MVKKLKCSIGNVELIKKFLKMDGDLYQVTPDGVVLTRVNTQGHITSTFRDARKQDGAGYCYINLKKSKVLVHRVIFQKYIGELDPQLTINHINGIKNDNCPANLEQVSIGENILHRYRVLGYEGTKGHSKINMEIANQIREDRKKGLAYKELVEKYQLCKSSISYIVNNKTWN